MRRILRPIPSLVFAAAVLCGRAGLASDAPSAPPKAAEDVPQGLPAVTDAALEEALVAAGKHRPALEAALAHFATRGEPAKAAAVRFLVANMPGKGYIVTAWKAKDGTTVTYDPLAYPTFKEAVAAFDALEAAHGAIDAVRDHIVLDVETMTTAYLVRHVDNAFAAWRNAPPGQRVAGPAFAEHVLPYRGSEEPLEDWLTPLLARYATAPDEVVKTSTPRACLDWVGGDAGRRVRFDERYYLHPTDQGFAEMERSGMGRCEDITNMTTYAARARGLAVAADYTPAWGHRDNNHAWPVLLDASGRGSEAGNAHAAKVYRKVFSLQRDGLPYRLPAGREPREDVRLARGQVRDRRHRLRVHAHLLGRRGRRRQGRGGPGAREHRDRAVLADDARRRRGAQVLPVVHDRQVEHPVGAAAHPREGRLALDDGRPRDRDPLAAVEHAEVGEPLRPRRVAGEVHRDVGRRRVLVRDVHVALVREEAVRRHPVRGQAERQRVAADRERLAVHLRRVRLRGIGAAQAGGRHGRRACAAGGTSGGASGPRR